MAGTERNAVAQKNVNETAGNKIAGNVATILLINEGEPEGAVESVNEKADDTEMHHFLAT